MTNPDTLAERQRLATRALAALNDLANLDARVLELQAIAAGELRALYPDPNAGPSDPPTVVRVPPEN